MKNNIEAKKYLLITFDSTSYAYLMERLRREDELDGRLIPLPKTIDAGCGACFATENFDIDFWKNYMREKKILYNKIYEEFYI